MANENAEMELRGSSEQIKIAFNRAFYQYDYSTQLYSPRGKVDTDEAKVIMQGLRLRLRRIQRR